MRMGSARIREEIHDHRRYRVEAEGASRAAYAGTFVDRRDGFRTQQTNPRYGCGWSWNANSTKSIPASGQICGILYALRCVAGLAMRRIGCTCDSTTVSCPGQCLELSQRSWRATRPDTVGVIEQTEQAFSAWRTVRRTVQADTFLVGLLAYNQMRG